MKLTELETKALKVLCQNTYGDCDHEFNGEEQSAWFGSSDDVETREDLIKNGINGKTISGVISSLKQKGVIAVDKFEGKSYYYIPDKTYQKHYSCNSN
jgi:hypothetical protein